MYNEQNNKALLIAVITPESSVKECESSLDELERLADTAGFVAAARIYQSRPNPDVATFIGKGKLEEIKEIAKNNSISTIIADDELTPTQIKNIEDELDGEVEVIDRTMLILEIFSMHAKTGEGKLQVEIAYLRYTFPRLIGKGKEMSRLGGGGTAGGGMGARRGAGETKLEIDRRNVKSRIAALEEEIRQLEITRGVMRARREKSNIPNVAIAGYTNSGKSTLLNFLTDAGILAEDKLFATLDPTTRRMKLPNGNEILFTDTVGLIKKLPHQLVKAFRSTLDEIIYSDIILIVADASHPEYIEQLSVTRALLGEMDIKDKPIIIAYNKCDLIDKDSIIAEGGKDESHVFISAKTGEGIENLLTEIQNTLEKAKSKVTFIIPNSEMGSINYLYKNAVVLDVEYNEESVAVNAVVDSKVKGMYRQYMS